MGSSVEMTIWMNIIFWQLFINIYFITEINVCNEQWVKNFKKVSDQKYAFKLSQKY